MFNVNEPNQLAKPDIGPDLHYTSLKVMKIGSVMWIVIVNSLQMEKSHCIQFLMLTVKSHGISGDSLGKPTPV